MIDKNLAATGRWHSTVAVEIAGCNVKAGRCNKMVCHSAIDANQGIDMVHTRRERQFRKRADAFAVSTRSRESTAARFTVNVKYFNPVRRPDA